MVQGRPPYRSRTSPVYCDVGLVHMSWSRKTESYKVTAAGPTEDGTIAQPVDRVGRCLPQQLRVAS